MILVFCLIIQSYERQRIDEILYVSLYYGCAICRDFSKAESHAKHSGIQKITKKILSMDRLEPSKSNNQAIGCLETITFVVSGLF